MAIFLSFAIFAVGAIFTTAGKIFPVCDEFEERTQNCWENENNAPDCRKIYQLMSCLDDSVLRFPDHCVKGKHQAQQKLGVAQLLFQAFCSNRELHEEFLQKKYCWHLVRRCLENIPVNFEEVIYRYSNSEDDESDVQFSQVSSSFRDEVVGAECYKQNEEIKNCNKKASDECFTLDQYSDAVLKISVCKNYKIENCPECAKNFSIAEELVKLGYNTNSAHTNSISIFLILTLLSPMSTFIH